MTSENIRNWKDAAPAAQHTEPIHSTASGAKDPIRHCKDRGHVKSFREGMKEQDRTIRIMQQFTGGGGPPGKGDIMDEQKELGTMHICGSVKKKIYNQMVFI